MAYAFDFLDDGDVRAWSLTPEGATAERITDYTPSLFVVAGEPPPAALTESGREALLGDLQGELRPHPAVVETAIDARRRGFRRDPEPALRLDLTSVDALAELARSVADRGITGTYRCFDVDLSPGFRFCLDRGIDPVPARDLRTLEVAVPPGCDPPVGNVVVDGDPLDGDASTVVDGLQARIDDRDPDVVFVDRAGTVPALFETARAVGAGDFRLGRRAGYRKLAGESTYHSYGRVGHSPARYAVPGRVVIDRSNTFFLGETNLAGCLDLVERSRKPLGELSWASIGNVLTAIQIRAARRRNVVVPWRSWRHERFKSMRTLESADRGGFTFAPEVGVHEDVHEVDFASLYPNVIVTRNVSPDTIRCECHADREDVPGIGYSICDERGYLPDVLEPLVDAREAIKGELATADDPARRGELEGRSSALKWILVSCFGYQGFSNAKFGRIECHEAINAFAREILLDAKTALEDAGWRVVHGIVDSLWVTPADRGATTPLASVCESVTDEVGIRLEYEDAFDWVAFCPRADDDAGALTHYFGRRSGVDPDDEDAYKFRGIECRQRSTPPFVARVQRRLVRTFDRTRDPQAVVDDLRVAIGRLERDAVDPAELATEIRVSKDVDAYDHATRTVAALERAAATGRRRSPGQTVRYVVADDGKRSRERVRLASEVADGDARVDRAFYRDRVVDAAASVLAPVGWRRPRIEEALADSSAVPIDAFE